MNEPVVVAGAPAGGDAKPVPLLWEHHDELAARLQASPLLVCFDYDGTLVPIRPTPEEAVADGATQRDLRRLAAHPGVVVAVASGRPVAQLRELMPAGALWLIGLHGLETAAPGREPETHGAAAEWSRQLQPLHEVAVDLAWRYEGVRVEDKGPTLALHTRQASAADAEAAAAAFKDAAAALEGFEVLAGKEVLEARPCGIHKGSAVTRLWRQTGAAAVLYVGDDTTDEDAFAALAGEPQAITVRVGAPPSTNAAYRLAAQVEVRDLLLWIDRLRSPQR